MSLKLKKLNKIFSWKICKLIVHLIKSEHLSYVESLGLEQ